MHESKKITKGKARPYPPQRKNTAATAAGLAKQTATGTNNRASQSSAGTKNDKSRSEAKATRQARRQAERRSLSTEERVRGIATLRALRQIEPSRGRHAVYSESTPDWKIPPRDR